LSGSALRRAAAVLLCVAAGLPAGDGAWGSREIAGTGRVELAFTPGDAIDARIVAAIDAAEREVLVLAFSFTQPRIAQALVAARGRGVDVEVVADRGQARETPHSAVAALAQAGVPVWLDGNYSAAHNKVVIVDAGLARATTITGSYNFTVAAQKRNAENVAIFRDNAEVATTYRAYFKRLQARAQRWEGGEAPQTRRSRR
jgi:phosphatidylserine/phosphatidylglycerophosphate/cardiolipin synthase-like enzyme